MPCKVKCLPGHMANHHRVEMGSSLWGLRFFPFSPHCPAVCCPFPVVGKRELQGVGPLQRSASWGPCEIRTLKCREVKSSAAQSASGSGGIQTQALLAPKHTLVPSKWLCV